MKKNINILQNSLITFLIIIFIFLYFIFLRTVYIIPNEFQGQNSLILYIGFIIVIIAVFLFFFLIVTIFSFRVIIRNKDWKDGLTLYAHDIQYAKNSFDLENNYGVELFRIEEFEKAKLHFQKSISLQPEWMYSHNNLGAVYHRQGEIEKAKEEYIKSLELGNYYFAYENLATILLKEDNKKALEFLEEGLLMFPRSINLKKFLSIAYYRNGEIQKSINLLSNLLEENPQDQYINYLLWTINRNEEIIL